MLRSFDSLALRQIRTRPLRAVLTTFGIVLGVGMVFGVLLLVGTIRHTFDQLFESVYGNTDLVASGEFNAGSLPAGDLAKARAVPGVAKASGDVLGVFTLIGRDGRAEKGAKAKVNVAGWQAGAYDLGTIRVLAGRKDVRGGEIALASSWAKDHGIGLGDTIRFATPSGVASLKVAGIIEYTSGLSFGGQGFGRIDLATARALMDKPGVYDEIRIVAGESVDTQALSQRVKHALGRGVDVRTPQAVSADVNEQLQGLNVVLYFFSGMALFVGAFLILNSFNMTVLQRMREIGMLRTIGTTRGMVVRSVMVEALALGVIGTVLGLALGIGLAAGLIRMVGSIGLPVGTLQLSASDVTVAVVLGLAVTAAGALYPAARASRVAPIRAVLSGTEARKRTGIGRAVLGTALFLPGLLLGGLFWFGDFNTGSAAAGVLGIGGTMAMFVGMALAAPFVIMPLIAGLAVPFRRLLPTGGRLAADSLRGNPARTSATAAALMICLSVVVVDGAMSASFLGSIDDQINRNFAQDLTIQPQGLEAGGPVPGISPALRRQIAAIPEAGTVTPKRSIFLKLPEISHGSKIGEVDGVDPRVYPRLDFSTIKGASRALAYGRVARGGVIVSNRYADRAGLRVGDRLSLKGPAGTQSLPVAGIVTTLAGGGIPLVVMSLGTMHAIYGVTADTQILMRARSAPDRALLERKVQALVDRRYPNLEVLSNAELKANIDNHVNRQFALFNAIMAIAVIVSLLGVINTLAMSVMERTREIGVLRALGSSRWQVRRTMLDESLLMTLAGAVAGILFGALIGWAWVKGIQINLEGLAFRFPATTVLLVALGGILLGVLAAILPARRAARLNVIQALSYE